MQVTPTQLNFTILAWATTCPYYSHGYISPTVGVSHDSMTAVEVDTYTNSPLGLSAWPVNYSKILVLQRTQPVSLL